MRNHFLKLYYKKEIYISVKKKSCERVIHEGQAPHKSEEYAQKLHKKRAYHK